MKKLKIGFVFDDSLDRTDGVQQYILSLGQYFSSCGHQVYYLTGNTIRKDIKNVYSLSKNIKVRFNKNILSIPLPTNHNKISKLINQLNLDVIHVQMPFSPFLAGNVIDSVDKNKTVIIGTFHIVGYHQIEKIGSKILATITRKQLNKFNRIYSVSSAAEQFAKKTFKIESTIMPNVIDFDRFNQTRSISRSNEFNVLFLGRLVSRKGCITLLRAIKILKENHQIPINMRITIAGDGPLKVSLINFCKYHDLTNIVKFVGYVSESFKIKLYQKAEICVFPATGGESFGIVLLESMAAGNSVVLAANNSGYNSVLKDYPDRLFPINNSQVLSEKIMLYYTNKALRRKAILDGIKCAKQYDVKIIGDQLIDNYNSLLSKN